MQFMRSRFGGAALAAASLLSLPASAAYVSTLVDYRDASGAVAAYTTVWGMNDKGQFVGNASMTDPYGQNGVFNFIYDPESGFQPIQPFDTSNPVGFVGINNSGTATGGVYPSTGEVGFIWSGGTYLLPLFSYPGSLDTEGRAISNPTTQYPMGLVVGYADMNPHLILNTGFPFIYDPNRAVSSETPPNPTTFSLPNSYRTIAQGINSYGQIVGSVVYANGSGSPMADGTWSSSRPPMVIPCKGDPSPISKPGTCRPWRGASMTAGRSPSSLTSRTASTHMSFHRQATKRSSCPSLWEQVARRRSPAPRALSSRA